MLKFGSSCLALALLFSFVPARSASADAVDKCLRGSGSAATRCLRLRGAQLEGAGGSVSKLLNKTGARAAKRCDADSAEALGYTNLADLPFRIAAACDAFAVDIHGLALADPASSLMPSEVECQDLAVRQARKLRGVVVREYGRCIVADRRSGSCKREARDKKVTDSGRRARNRVLKGCGNDFDVLGPFAGASVRERVETFADTVVTRSRHYAQQVYPPDVLGPTADYGPFPIGLQTLELLDASRLNVAGDGPRPVTVEVYYPSTDAAVAGVPREVVELLGFTVATVPAHRDVAMAAGTRPLVLFSHGNLGIRLQSFFFAGHLASHGYIVVSPDHHGNTFLDLLSGELDMQVVANRPLDMSFLIDEFLDFNATGGDFFEGAIDPTRIGASGHSFGGLTVLALAGGESAAGTFTDSRVAAIFPQAPASPFADSFFSTITIPTMIIGGSIDGTTPFASDQQRPYDLLPVGADPVALVEVVDAGHFSFSDFCEVPSAVLGFLGGAPEACEPRHLPWRYAQDITKYFALNFFDAALSADPSAQAALDAGLVSGLEDLRYERK